MGWKTINGRRYYYKSERDGGRVKSTYFGAGEAGTLMAKMVAFERVERAAEREELGKNEKNPTRRKRPSRNGSMESRPWPTRR